MNKVALVTGASRGIGRQIAIDLSKAGYEIIINYNKSHEKAKDLVDKIRSNGYKAQIYRADVSQENQVIEMFDYIYKTYGRLDLLVNNAGVALDGSLLTDTSTDDWNYVIDSNLRSVYLYSREALKIMQPQHDGKIINIASMWGEVGGSCEVIYSASKAGVIGLTKALAKEVGPSGIRVNCVSPGVIMTDMMEGYTEDDLACLRDETPIMELGKVGDISSMVLYLASKEAGFITGQIMSVNGGIVI